MFLQVHFLNEILFTGPTNTQFTQGLMVLYWAPNKSTTQPWGPVCRQVYMFLSLDGGQVCEVCHGGLPDLPGAPPGHHGHHGGPPGLSQGLPRHLPVLGASARRSARARHPGCHLAPARSVVKMARIAARWFLYMPNMYSIAMPNVSIHA